MTAENMPMEDFDKHKEVASLLDLCVKKFRQAPSKKEAAFIVDLLCEKLKLKEIIHYLDTLHYTHKTFPYVADIEKDIAVIERARKFQYTAKPKEPITKQKPWISTQAAGTPAQAEALFNLIKKGATKGLGFEMLRRGRLLGKLTDDQIWASYDSWCRGEIHDSLKILIDDPFA